MISRSDRYRRPRHGLVLVAAGVLLVFGIGARVSAASVQSVVVGLAPTDLVSADVNADGDDEVLVANLSDGSITLVQVGRAGLTADIVASTAAPVAIDVADIDGDGRLDLVVGDAGAPALEIYPALAGGGWGNPAVLPLGGDPGDVLPVDIDDDGDLEILVSELDTGIVRIVDGAALTTITSMTLGGRPYRMTAGDLDGDGDTEALVVDADGGDVVVVDSGGEVARLTGPTTPVDVAIVDLRRDGVVDILVADAGADTVWRWEGIADLSPTAVLAAAGSFPSRIAIQQLRGSPDPDVAVSLRSAGQVVVIDGRRPAARHVVVPLAGCPSAIESVAIGRRTAIVVADLCGTDLAIIR